MTLCSMETRATLKALMPPSSRLPETTMASPISAPGPLPVSAMAAGPCAAARHARSGCP